MEAKQLLVIRSAQKLFLKHGYLKVSMSDIAEDLGISRPTLYKSFANKETILDALLTVHSEECRLETEKRLPKATTFAKRLQTVLDIWVIDPFAMAIENENGRDLMSNGPVYSPLVFDRTYKLIQDEIYKILLEDFPAQSPISAKDLAQTLSFAIKGIKSSATSVAEMKKLMKGIMLLTRAFVGE